jgi:hypothetical protein
MLSVITPSIRPQFLDGTQQTLEHQTYQDFEWLVEIGLRNRGCSLSKDFNKMLKRARGDIIVILQDCMVIPIDSLQRIAALDHEKKAYTYPVAKGGKFDWRKYRTTALGPDKAKLTANQWEIDFASAPRSLFYDVGGFDERFDEGWSWENVEIGWRATFSGYEFYVSQEAEALAVDHDKLLEHPWRNKRPNNDQKANETWRRAERGDFKLSYL